MTLLKGLSISEIAKELDIVPTTVRRTIKSYYKLQILDVNVKKDVQILNILFDKLIVLN